MAATPNDDRSKPTEVGEAWAAPEPPPTSEATASTPSSTVTTPSPTLTTSSSTVTKPTRISGTWVAVIIATVVLIFLLIFILENMSDVTVSFLGLSGTLPLGVALLFAAIAGALLVALIGAARILQLRRRVRRIDR